MSPSESQGRRVSDDPLRSGKRATAPPARPLVSAIVTTRNRANLLREALESILHQDGTGQEFDQETLVVDDASTDFTADVMAKYPSVQYIRQQERRGPSAARNVGALASHGQYIAFLDDDDLWLPGKLRLQVRALESHPEAGAVYSHGILQREGREEIWPKDPNPPSGAIFAALLKANLVGGVDRCLIRRAALDSAGHFDERLTTGEDYDLWLRLAFHFPFVFVPGRVGIYRPSPSGKLGVHLAEGRRTDAIRYTAEKAIALLPDTPHNALLKQQARAWAEIRVVLQLAEARAADLALSQMIEAVRRCPTILHKDEVRDTLVLTVRRCVETFDSPFSRARAVGEELHAAAGDRESGHDLRCTLAAIWGDAAVDLVRSSPRHWREVWSALMQAVRHDGAHMTRRLFRGTRKLLQDLGDGRRR